MTRVAVVGNAGGGKSTMCRKLGAALKLPVYAIDKLQWRPGWVPTPLDEFRRQHEQLITQERWIIDGWGPFDTMGARFALADTIIVVDHALYVHYWWALKRQFKTIFRPRPDGPEGCPLLPMTWQLLKMMWRIQTDGRPELLRLVDSFRNQKRIIHIRSPRELHQFIEQYC